VIDVETVKKRVLDIPSNNTFKEITGETHPEIYSEYVKMCKDVGLPIIPLFSYKKGCLNACCNYFSTLMENDKGELEFKPFIEEAFLIIHEKNFSIFEKEEILYTLGHELSHLSKDNITLNQEAKLLDKNKELYLYLAFVCSIVSFTSQEANIMSFSLLSGIITSLPLFGYFSNILKYKKKNWECEIDADIGGLKLSECTLETAINETKKREKNVPKIKIGENILKFFKKSISEIKAEAIKKHFSKALSIMIDFVTQLLFLPIFDTTHPPAKIRIEAMEKFVAETEQNSLEKTGYAV